ncbi:PP2C-like domain-containing protein CG9801 isoform X2 [Watersipora subatra]
MPPEVWCAKSAAELQRLPLDKRRLRGDVISASYGPGDDALLGLEDCTNNNVSSKKRSGKDRVEWGRSSRKACGMAISLYDRNPVTGKVSGDPIADCFAQVSRTESSLIVIADGVNWGERSRLAASCAVTAAVDYLTNKLFLDNDVPSSTQEVLDLMRKAFDLAHELILQHGAGLTTLGIAAILPIEHSTQYAVCSVNVGDSLAYVFSKRYGMNELSIGSHDITVERDIKDAGGAIGPVNGEEPYLTNLTFCLTTCEPGDIVFLTTDGVSDNYDPVVTKLAVPACAEPLLQSVDTKPAMLPCERHLFAMKGMERVIHEYELETHLDISSKELCLALTQHIVSLTSQKRLVIENPVYYNRRYKAKERRKIEDTIRNTIRTLPGKLDHATVVAYEAGVYTDESSPNEAAQILAASMSATSFCSSPKSHFSHRPAT